MSDKTATRTATTIDAADQYAAIYMLSEPITYTKLENSGADEPGYVERNSTTSFVWVSSVRLWLGGVETMVFACDAAGTVLHWVGVAQTQTWSHADALDKIGFAIADAIDANASEPAPKQIPAPESRDETA